MIILPTQSMQLPCTRKFIYSDPTKPELFEKVRIKFQQVDQSSLLPRFRGMKNQSGIPKGGKKMKEGSNTHCPYQLVSPGSAGETEDLLAGKSQEEGLRRIQALLADWLRMENLVVLTAAGASYGAGGRLMSGRPETNLECLVLDAVEKCASLSDEARSVIAWKKANSFGEGNFEDWLSYLFSATGLAGSVGSPIESVLWKDGVSLPADDLERLCVLIQRAIYAECALELDLTELSTDGGPETSGYIPFLAKLIARDATLGRTHLFTLNYDTLNEQAMEELGIQYFDGFTGKANSRFDPSVYGLDIYYPGDVSEGKVRRFDKFLQFYKPHGSIHWRVDGSGLYRAQHASLSMYAEYRDSDADVKAGLLESEAYEAIPSFGILPTSRKYSQTLEMPFAHLFRLFQARLNQPQTFLLVLGYGFGDDHVTRIIETALMNPSLVMLVVEPNPNSPIIERIRKYQSLGQRAFVLSEKVAEGAGCSFARATFSDFAQNVMPDIKWLDDYKRLRIFEDQIRKTGPKTDGEG